MRLRRQRTRLRRRIDHHSDRLAEELARGCPQGIDICFENVGGPVFDAMLPLMNPFGRISVSGLIAHYSAIELPPGPNRVPLLIGAILTKHLSLRGFIVTDFRNERCEFEREMAQWLREGKVRYREDAVDGLVNAVATFKGLFRGQISASYSSASPPNRIGPRPVSRNKAISITQFIRAAQKQFRISP